MSQCRIVDIRAQDSELIDSLAELSYAAFRAHAPTWLTTTDNARAEVVESLEAGRKSRALVTPAGEPVAWIGVIPHNSGRVWEIHPLAVRPADQGRGYGRRLVKDIERLAQSHGVLTLFAGTSDETGATSLFGADLYDDPLSAMANITGQGTHPYKFWLGAGFRIVGVMPDAEGVGRPGIHLAKSVTNGATEETDA